MAPVESKIVKYIKDIVKIKINELPVFLKFKGKTSIKEEKLN